MIFNDNLQTETGEIFTPNKLRVHSNAWSGQALFLGSDFVIRQRYRLEDGKILRLNLPKTDLYELTRCGDGWFLLGVCGRKRVAVHLFLEEVLEGRLGDDPERALALRLIVMTPSLGAEMMERFGANEGASLQKLMPWKEWIESRAALDAIYAAEPWLDGPNPIDLTASPSIVAFAERRGELLQMK